MPVDNSTKFLTVLGTVSPKRPISIVPTLVPPMLMWKNTLSVTKFIPLGRYLFSTVVSIGAGLLPTVSCPKLAEITSQSGASLHFGTAHFFQAPCLLITHLGFIHFFVTLLQELWFTLCRSTFPEFLKYFLTRNGHCLLFCSTEVQFMQESPRFVVDRSPIYSTSEAKQQVDCFG